MKKETEKLYTIGEFARLTAVTERTLRFYDRKGLLMPSLRNEHGHRFYSKLDLFQLQKIITLKYMDFTLEEIEQYLQSNTGDFRQTLDAQHELLLLKRRKLNQVLDAIERIQYVIQDANELDVDLLILYIHSIQHEGSQKQWLAGQMPRSLVETIFMEGVPKEERLEFERRLTAKFTELKQFYKEGRSTKDPVVVECGKQMLELYKSLLGDALEGLSEGDLAFFEADSSQSDPLDPVLFPNIFTPDEEAFFKEVFDQLEELINSGERSVTNGEA